MAVAIRLLRQGKKHAPQYLVVAVDQNKKRDGEFLENLGQYFPSVKEAKAKAKLNLDGIQAWVKKGAQMSKTVKYLVKTQA